MPYPANFGKITWGGTAFNNAEIWQTGLHVTATKLPGSPEMADILKALTTWMGDNQSTHRLTWCKWAEIGTNGRYASQDSPVLRDMDVRGGISGAVSMPGQLTLAVTLLSDHRRGPGSKGRIYPPPIGFNIGNDGLVPTDVATKEATRTLTLIKAVNAAASGFFGQVCLVSPGGKKGDPIIAPVTGVSVGRVVDTQRRRRNSIKEAAIRVPLA